MLKIEGFNVESKSVKNKGVSLEDIFVFPVLIIAAPFLIVGFAFFSIIDKIRNGSKNDFITVMEQWHAYEFELVSLQKTPFWGFKLGGKTELYYIKSVPEIPSFKDFKVAQYLYTKNHGYFLGFANGLEFMQLIIITDNTSYSVDLGEGNWAFEDDHHHENDYCQLRNWGEKTSTIFTLKPKEA
jgi:hypothetical protein